MHLIVGGEAAVLDRVRPLLDAIAERVMHVGAVGAGQVLKLINNAVTIGNTAILCEVFTVARARGVDLAMRAEALGNSMAGSKVLPTVSKRLIEGNHRPLFTTGVVKKDISPYTALAAGSPGILQGAGWPAAHGPCRRCRAGNGHRRTALLSRRRLSRAPR